MERKPISDEFIASALREIPEDSRYIYTLSGGKFRLCAMQCTRMVNQMRANFELGFLETYVLGQAYIAGGLLAGEVKGNDRIVLNVQCGGPIKGFSVEAWACGAVRGHLVDVPIAVDRPVESSQDLNLLYGPGFLSVTKLLEGNKDPFTGDVMMEYGDLAKDLALYYQQSEQTPSVFDLSLKFDRQGRVLGAGGLFIQVLPGCGEEDIEKMESLIRTIPYVGKQISEGVDMREYVAGVFKEMNPSLLGKAPVMFSCPCTRENFLAHLRSLPESELDDMCAKNDFPVRVSCLNCGTEYSFGKEEVIL